MLPSWELSMSRPNQGHILLFRVIYYIIIIKTSLLLHLPSPREIGWFILWQIQIILMLAERLQAGQVSGAPAPSSSSSSVLWYPPTHPYHVFCLDQLPRYIFQSSPGPTAIPFLALWASSWYFLWYKSSSLSVTDTRVYLWKVWGYLEIPSNNQAKKPAQG